LVGSFDGLACGEIHRLQGAAKSGNWLEIAADTDFLAVGDAAFNTSGIVAGAGECGVAGGRGVADFVVHGRAGSERGGDTGADLYGLDRLQRHYGGCEHSIETLVPLHVGAEAGGNLVSYDFEDATEGVSGFKNL